MIHSHNFIHINLFLLLETLFTAYVLGVAQIFIAFFCKISMPIQFFKLFKKKSITTVK